MNLRPVEILSESMLNKHSLLETSSASLTKEFLHDNDSETIWESETASDDFTEQILFNFAMEGKTFSPPDCPDAIILENTNVKNISVSYFDVSGNAREVVPNSLISGENFVLRADLSALGENFYPVGAKIFLYSAQTADAPKRAGQVRVCKSKLLLDDALTNFSKQNEARSGSYRTISGALVSWKEWSKFAGQMKIINLTAEKTGALDKLCRENRFLTILYNSCEDYSVLNCAECVLSSPPGFSLNKRTNLSECQLNLRGK